MSVAQTILAQLGGNKFLAMTGSSNLQSSPFSLSFRLPTVAGGKVNYVKITLDSGTDLYSVECGKIRGSSYKVITALDGVYADNLVFVIESETGFACSL